jgi:hypothetical protein
MWASGRDNTLAAMELAHDLHELTNFAILAGYLAAAFYFIALLNVPSRVRALGVTFFVTCGGTHVFMALVIHRADTRGLFGSEIWLAMLGWHLVEACAIWLFLLEARRYARHAGVG